MQMATASGTLFTEAEDSEECIASMFTLSERMPGRLVRTTVVVPSFANYWFYSILLYSADYELRHVTSHIPLDFEVLILATSKLDVVTEH